MAVLLVRNCRRFFVIGLFAIASVQFVLATGSTPVTAERRRPTEPLRRVGAND